MVKNQTGGNKQKSQARKYSVNVRENKLRLSEDEGEKYAQVVSLLGNGMCYVIIDNNTKLLCIIRGKFKGRGKRDNIIKKGSWVLVGLREWEHAPNDKNKFQKCDLLELYSDYNKEQLKKIEGGPWKLFINNDNEFTHCDTDDVEFAEDTNEAYKKIMQSELNATTIIRIKEDDEEINVDDI
jgi:translation initiation factor IF-1